MPETENASILSSTLELLHINFRELRQHIEHEMVALKSQALTAAEPLESVLQRISSLQRRLHTAKDMHLRRTGILRRRVQFWLEYELIKDTKSCSIGGNGTNSADSSSSSGSSSSGGGSGAETLANNAEAYDLPFVVQIANYLAERGCYTSALDRLLALRPDIAPLTDVDILKEETTLINQIKAGDYAGLLKWCRHHRSSLKRAGSKLELHIQLKKFRRMLSEGHEAEAVLFAKKAFSRANAVDYASIMEASSLLCGMNNSQPTNLDTMVDEDSIVDAEIVSEIKEAVRQVYRLPKQNPLISNVLVGAAALKTCRCDPGSLAIGPVDGQLPAICPLCRSIKMRPLFDAVPYAQHTRSHLDADLKMLPSGAVFGSAEISQYMAANYPEVWAQKKVVDIDGEPVPVDQLVSVYAL